MTHLTFTNNGKTYRQITKRTAKRLYCEGKTIIAVPANIRPFNPWGLYCELSQDNKIFHKVLLATDKMGADKQFVRLCDSATYYLNCNNERGKYLRFYAEF